MELPKAPSSDPNLAKVRLRKELTTSLRLQDGKPYLLIRDSLRSKYFRLGVEEWRIVTFFDGLRTLRQVVRDAAQKLGGDRVSPTEIHRLANWLVGTGLAECLEGNLGDRGDMNAGNGWKEAIDKAAQAGRWNPLFLNVGLPNPEPVLQLVYPYVKWMFSRFALVAWLTVCTFGGYSVLSQWERFRNSLHDVFLKENWIYLFVGWLLLKLFHELAHAVACMRYGGRVTRWGLMLILFSPIAWVDVTSTWNFRSKWTRMIVSAAGMYAELLIAGIAAIIWANTEDVFAATISRNVVIAASIGTLLFNLNFLMRFDGYYIISDLLEIQNLYSAGQQYVQYLIRRHLLGMSVMPPQARGGKLAIIGVYGILSLVWRVAFCLGIILIAARLFHGAGIVLALFSAAIWFGLPLLRFATLLAFGHAEQQPNRLRFGLIAAALTLAVAGVFMLPWPGATRAHGVVDFSPRQAIRVDSPGFVQRILVRPGQEVKAGQLLLQLDNPELRRELADIELQLRMHEISRRVMHREDQMARYVAARQKLQSLVEHREQLAVRVQALDVRAPITGTVIANGLESLTGSYVQPGDELLSVGAVGEKELRIAIRQSDVESFRQTLREPVTFLIRGRRLSSQIGRLEKVHPRATDRVIHSGLAATYGGPLAVRRDEKANNGQSIQLIEPHFEGVIAVPCDVSRELRAGEMCQVSLGCNREKVYARLWSFAREYLEGNRGRGV